MILDIFNNYKKNNPYGQNCKINTINVNDKFVFISFTVYSLENKTEPLGIIEVKENEGNTSIIFIHKNIPQKTENLKMLKESYYWFGEALRAFQSFEMFFKIEKMAQEDV